MLIFSFLVEIIPLHQRGFVKMTMPINIYIVNTTSERELRTNFMDPNFLDLNFLDPKFFDPNFFKPNILDPKFLDPNFWSQIFWTYGRKNNCWFVRKKSSPASFSIPGINLPAYRNIYSPQPQLPKTAPELKIYIRNVAQDTSVYYSVSR